MPAYGTIASHPLYQRIAALRVLIVDDESYMRRVLHSILTTIGIRTVYEAYDGLSGYTSAQMNLPDIVITDWEMPMLDGPGLIKMLRSPRDYLANDVPIILLASEADHAKVVESARVGANELLLKPVSIKAVFDRMVSVIAKPRPLTKIDDSYAPMPRRLVVLEANSGTERRQSSKTRH